MSIFKVQGGLAAAVFSLGVVQVAQAQPVADVTIAGVSETGNSSQAVVDLLIINGGGVSRNVVLPDQVEAVLDSGQPVAVTLLRSPETPASITVEPGAFARGRYTFAIGRDETGPGPLLISIPQWNTPKVVVARSEADRPSRLATAPLAPPETLVVAALPDRSVQSRLESEENTFFSRLSAYQPTYIAFGTAHDSEWRVQLSFKYKLLGSAARKEGGSWSDGLYLGFTNRMFWDLASDASFRDTNYAPELFYRTPETALSSNVGAGLQFGLQHESNARSGRAEGRSVNNVYVSPTVSFDMGEGYRLTAAPRLSFLVGGKAGNPDIMSYRGATSLDLRVGKDDGLMFATSARYNFSSGRGALSNELSYPLTGIWDGAPNFYFFVQNFVGYGESLRDYNRRMTRLRAGIALTR